MENRSDNRTEALADRIKQVRERIAESCLRCGRSPEEIRLLAATKTIPPEVINQALNLGITLIGENRVQELTEKFEKYGRCDVHFIGALQSNKVKQVLPRVSLIHSLDRISLAKEIEKQSALLNKITDVLIEVNIGGETAKSGVPPEQLEEFLCQVKEFAHIRVQGLMTVPPKAGCEKYFSAMQQIFIDIKQKNIDNVSMDILSMGMSGDYPYAIQYGSNLVRLGTAIFGPRL